MRNLRNLVLTQHGEVQDLLSVLEEVHSLHALSRPTRTVSGIPPDGSYHH
jgi:hypothetical protein